MEKKFVVFGMVLTIFLISGCIQLDQEDKYCAKEGTNQRLSLSEGKEIARNSECGEMGELEDKYVCNENSGTWWIDLDVRKEGCNPACVVNVETREAKINWRCTGLITRE